MCFFLLSLFFPCIFAFLFSEGDVGAFVGLGLSFVWSTVSAVVNIEGFLSIILLPLRRSVVRGNAACLVGDLVWGVVRTAPSGYGWDLALFVVWEGGLFGKHG